MLSSASICVHLRILLEEINRENRIRHLCNANGKHLPRPPAPARYRLRSPRNQHGVTTGPQLRTNSTPLPAKHSPKTIQDLGFESPVTMALMSICTQGDERPAILEKFDDACTLASDLAFDDAPGIIVSTLGGLHGTWDEVKHTYCDQLLELGDRRRKTQRHPRNRTPCGPPARHPSKSRLAHAANQSRQRQSQFRHEPLSR